MELSRAISELKSIRDRASDPGGFYLVAAQEWGPVARQLARTELMAARPPGRDARDWELRVNRLLGTFELGQSRGRGFTGVSLFMGLKQVQQRDLISDGVGVTTEDIVEYVAAGRRGDPLGKDDFNQLDMKKNDWQIAENIRRSLRKGNQGRLEKIKRFLSDRDVGELREAMKGVLAVWKEYFGARGRLELTEWLGG